MKKCPQGEYYCYTEKKCKKIPKGWHVMSSGYLARDDDEEDQKKKEGTNGNGDSSNGGESVSEDLRKWFGKGGEGGVGGGGWDRYNTKGERIGKCAREPGEPKPKCLSKEKAAKMSQDQIAAAVRRKRKSDPVADRPGKGGKPKMVSNKIDEAKKEQDHEQSMIRSELSTIENAVSRLRKKMKGEGNVEAWVQSKITKAADYIDTAADYVDSGEHDDQEEMDEAKKSGDPCWTGYKQVGMKKKGGKMVPNCVKEEEYFEEENVPTNPSLWSQAKSMAKKKFDVYPSAYANGWAAKWYKQRGGGWKSSTKEEVGYETELRTIETDLSYVDEASTVKRQTGNIVQIIFGWRGRTYQIKMFFPQLKKPSRKEIELELNKAYPDSKVWTFNTSELVPGQPFLHVNEENELDEGMTMKDFKKQRSRQKQKDKRAAEKTSPLRRAGIHADKASPERAARHRANVDPDFEGNDERNYPGGKLKNPKKIRKAKALGELGEDWQSVNRKDKTDGLSQKAVDAYRRENPGSKLQTAVTEKKPTGKRAERRKSFCRRMKGMKDKLTSAETSRDPDSRINKALRRWNCN